MIQVVNLGLKKFKKELSVGLIFIEMGDVNFQHNYLFIKESLSANLQSAVFSVLIIKFNVSVNFSANQNS